MTSAGLRGINGVKIAYSQRKLGIERPTAMLMALKDKSDKRREEEGIT